MPATYGLCPALLYKLYSVILNPTGAIMEKKYLEIIKNSIKTTIINNKMELTIPHFFADNKVLTLEVVCSDGEYFVSDQGQAIGYLKSQVAEDANIDELIEPICFKQGFETYFDDEFCVYISSSFSLRVFLHFLTQIANADLIYPWFDTDDFFPSTTYDYTAPTNASDDPSAFTNFLLEKIRVEYSDDSILIRPGITYPQNSTWAVYKLSLSENNIARLESIASSYDEGAIFETYLWQNDNLDDYEEYISSVTGRYGGFIEGNDLKLEFVYETDDDFIKNLSAYIRVATLLSAIGYTLSKEFHDAFIKRNS